MADNELDPWSQPDPNIAWAKAGWMERARVEAAKQGLWNPETKLPTQAGVVEALGSWANALMPGSPTGGGVGGIIAGPKALGAGLKPYGALEAQRLEANNSLGPAGIWTQTGWFKGPDGKLKWEIPDTDARLKTENLRANQFNDPAKPDTHLYAISGAGRTLGEILDHPELYKNYPELAQTMVRPVGMADSMSGLSGAVLGDGTMLLGGQKLSNMKSTLLHEVQHKVQNIEGFARGGMPQEFLAPDYAERLAANNTADMLWKLALPKEFNEYSWLSGQERLAQGKKPLPYHREHLEMFNRDFSGNTQEYLNHLVEKNQLRQENTAAYKNYQSLAGEVEARTVEERAASGDYSTIPTQTEGYPTYPQIVRFRDKTQGHLLPVGHDPFGGQ